MLERVVRRAMPNDVWIGDRVVRWWRVALGETSRGHRLWCAPGGENECDEQHLAEPVASMNNTEGDGHPVEDHPARELDHIKGEPQHEAESGRALPMRDAQASDQPSEQPRCDQLAQGCHKEFPEWHRGRIRAFGVHPDAAEDER